MSKLLIALATATILIAGGGIIWRANAAAMTNVGSLAPLSKSYTHVEEVAYWRRHYRRGYYGYGYRPYGYYGYGYRPYGYYGYRPYYGYGYGYGWRPGITISIGPRWGWGY